MLKHEIVKRRIGFTADKKHEEIIKMPSAVSTIELAESSPGERTFKFLFVSLLWLVLIYSPVSLAIHLDSAWWLFLWFWILPTAFILYVFSTKR
jgi:hypothetical protein